MKKENTKIVYKNGSLSFTLFIVFLILKLTNTINWSWWIVTLPLWIGFVIVLGIIFVALIFYLFMVILGRIFKWN